MAGQDPVVQAGICLYDYLLNPAVRGELNRALAAAKADAGNGGKILQDFLDRRKYATTPAVVKQVFAEYQKSSIAIPQQAVRFAVNVAASPVLRLDWYDAARQAARLQRAAPSAAAAAGDADPMAPLAETLKKNGFGDVTPLQASLATMRLMSSTIGAWAGVYSQTTIANKQGQSENGPILMIDATQDPVQVKLDAEFIFGYSFNGDTNTLSWTKEGSGSFKNQTAASLAFSNDGTTSSFSGTLELPKRDKYALHGTLDYQGSLDKPNNNGGSGGGGGLGTQDILGIVFGISGFFGTVATAVGAYYAWRAYRASRPAAQDPPDQVRDRAAEVEQRMDSAPQQDGFPRDVIDSAMSARELSGRLSSDVAAESIELQEQVGNLPANERARVEQEIEENASELAESESTASSDEYETANDEWEEIEL
jgi:hypothetical protein